MKTYSTVTFRPANGPLVAFSVVMFLMIVIVLVEAVRSWIRLAKIPQNYKTQAEVEAESLKKYGAVKVEVK